MIERDLRAVESRVEPITKKWLPFDVLDAGLHGVLKREKHVLECTIDFPSIVRHGFTSRGVPLYLAHPVHPGYPKFLVSSKTKYTTPMCATIQYEHWEDKCPRGSIVHIHGPVGDPRVEEKMLYKSIAYPGLPTYSPEPSRIAVGDTEEWDYVCNIDPAGCEDVDDVFFWRLGSAAASGSFTFGIGIADVSAIVLEETPLDAYAAAMSTTIYSPEGAVVHPMLPTSISSDIASLRADGVSRPVLALCTQIEGGIVVSVQWRLLLLKVNRAFTYDDIYEAAETWETIRTAVEIIAQKPITDSHVAVEAAMIYYNIAAARILRSGGVGVLRAHRGALDGAEYADIAAASGIDAIRNLGMAAGSYVSAMSSDSEVVHAGLGCALYTHATSPLRRYADLVNQRWLKAVTCGGFTPAVGFSILRMNARAGLVKRTMRQIAFLSFVNYGSVNVFEGVLYKVKEGRGWVYVPSLKTVLKGVLEGGVADIGSKVQCRLYVDIRAVNLQDRYVVSITRHS